MDSFGWVGGPRSALSALYPPAVRTCGVAEMQTAALDARLSARLMTQYKTQYARYTTTMRDMCFFNSTFTILKICRSDAPGSRVAAAWRPLAWGVGARCACEAPVVKKELLIGIKGILSKLGRVFDLN